MYDQSWADRGTIWFPYDSELCEVNEWLKQYGWSMPASWEPIIESEAKRLAKIKGISRMELSGTELVSHLEERLLLKKAGHVYEGNLKSAGSDGYFWSTSTSEKISAVYAYRLWFDSDRVVSSGYWDYRNNAFQVRYVS